MKRYAKRVHRFLVSEEGPTAVEYAVMLVLVVLVCLGAIEVLGTNTNQVFTDTASSMSAGS